MGEVTHSDSLSTPENLVVMVAKAVVEHIGNYLIVNNHQQFECRIKSRQMVEGLCIYLDPDLVQDIYQTQQHGHAAMLEGTNGQEDAFLEKIYALNENPLGQFLQDWIPLLRDPNQ